MVNETINRLKSQIAEATQAQKKSREQAEKLISEIEDKDQREKMKNLLSRAVAGKVSIDEIVEVANGN